MTINNKREINDEGKFLGWPVTSYGPETKSFFLIPASKVNIFLIIATVLFSGYVLVQSTFWAALTRTGNSRARVKQEGEAQMLELLEKRQDCNVTGT